MDKIFIRKGEIRDVRGIASIEKACFPMPWSEETVLNEMQNNELATYIVAEFEGTIVGYIGFWRVMDTFDINNIAVLPEYRRRGIGRSLLERVLLLMEEMSAENIFLEVRPSNLAAIEMYRRAGFEEVGIRKAYYEDNGEDAIIMSRYGVER